MQVKITMLTRNSKTNKLFNLPEVLLHDIISYLSMNENGKLALTSYLMWQLANDDVHWINFTLLENLPPADRKSIAIELRITSNIGKEYFLRDNACVSDKNKFLNIEERKLVNEKEKSAAVLINYKIIASLLYAFHFATILNDSQNEMTRKLFLYFFPLIVSYSIKKCMAKRSNFYKTSASPSIKLINAKPQADDFIKLLNEKIVFFERKREGFILSYISSDRKVCTARVTNNEDISALQALFGSDLKGQTLISRKFETIMHYHACYDIVINALPKGEDFEKPVIYQSRNNISLCTDFAIMNISGTMMAIYELTVYLHVDDIVSPAAKAPIAGVCLILFHVLTYCAAKFIADNLYGKTSHAVTYHYQRYDRSGANFFTASFDSDQIFKTWGLKKQN